MKQFNLELAKQGHPVCTRRGRDYEIMSFDKLSTVYPIKGRLKNYSQEYSHCKNGNYYIAGGGHPLDLFMKDDEPQIAKAMKITPETRVSELIPEGYELGEEKEKTNNFIEKPIVWGSDTHGYTIYLHVKKKQEKDFKWYAKQYLLEKQKISETKFDDINNWSFEYKIGLLKFICDDLKIPFPLSISTGITYMFKSNYEKLTSICPEEFLNSILK